MKDLKYSKITKITTTSNKDIYHLTVKNNHNFFGNNLCLHNCGYTGDLGVKIYNVGKEDVIIEEGERYAQIAVIKKPTYEIIELNDEEFEELKSKQQRGDGGFGSSGK
jgi:dUTPase